MNVATETRTAPDSVVADTSIRPLLDHIAAELAHEYIRLMEAAASADAAADTRIADA